jgi:hypothetical protein
MNLHRLAPFSLSLFTLVARTGSISQGVELASLAVARRPGAVASARPRRAWASTTTPSPADGRDSTRTGWTGWTGCAAKV